MLDREETAGPLWTCGEMMLKVQTAARVSDRIVRIRRPFARLGQASGAEITIRAPAASDQHVYLHLDPRGVYAVDLDTRTGTRFSGTERHAGWLRPGDWLEVAGCRVELLQAQIDGGLREPPTCDADLLADTGRTTLVGVVLEPWGAAGDPWVLNSELVFSGRSAACGIPIRDRTVARTHAALLRTETAAYVINLCGHRTRIDDRPVQGASIIHDGQLLTLGSARFAVSVEPATRPAAEHEPFRPGQNTLAVINPEVSNGSDLPAPLEAIPPESRRTILTWMMGTVQGSPAETLRQQEEFQRALAQLLHLIRQENATLLAAPLDEVEDVACALAELQCRGANRRANPPAVLLRPSPGVTPLPIARTILEQTGPPTSTTWLLERLSQIGSQNRSAWRGFLDRLALRRPRRTT